MTVRSQCLIQYSSTGASLSPRFTCPQGYVTLVKSAYVFNASTASVNVILEVQNASFAAGVWAVEFPLASLGAGGWEGSIALNPGDSVIMNNLTNNVAVWVSGAILLGTNQFPVAS